MAPTNTETGEWNWEALERQDWHLWILAMLLMFVLGISLISFMFPTVFWLGDELAVGTPQRAFFGFSILLALTLVYMLQRQATSRRLKRSLYMAQVAASEAEQRAHLAAFTSLPELGQFRDSLAMEFRRASHTGDHLTVILLDLPALSQEKMGRFAHLVRQALRPHETLFRMSEKRFGLILPGMRSQEAAAFADQIKDRIRLLLPEGGISATAVVYPEQAESLMELEGRLRALVS